MTARWWCGQMWRAPATWTPARLPWSWWMEARVSARQPEGMRAGQSKWLAGRGSRCRLRGRWPERVRVGQSKWMAAARGRACPREPGPARLIPQGPPLGVVRIGCGDGACACGAHLPGLCALAVVTERVGVHTTSVMGLSADGGRREHAPARATGPARVILRRPPHMGLALVDGRLLRACLARSGCSTAFRGHRATIRVHVHHTPPMATSVHKRWL